VAQESAPFDFPPVIRWRGLISPQPKYTSPEKLAAHRRSDAAFGQGALCQESLGREGIINPAAKLAIFGLKC